MSKGRKWLSKLKVLKNASPIMLVVVFVFFMIGMLLGPLFVVIITSALGGYR